ncbi:putative inactive protein kinase [Raphanus sativus]|nr:putative inactive protein kinase [Raphanus sativus]
MKRKENDDGFEYQTMDFDWNSGRYEERSEIPEKEAEGHKEEVRKEVEEEVKTETQAEDKEDEEAEKEGEVEVETEAGEKGAEKESETEVEVETEARVEVETEAWVEAEVGEKGAEKESETEVEVETEAQVDVETEARVDVETEAQVDVETEARVEVETEARVGEKGAEKEPKDTPTPPRGRIKANAAWKPETTTPEKWVAAKIAEAEHEKEEKQGWILTVCKSKDAISAVETDGTEGAPARTGVKHRPKAMAVRKHRSRKADEPKKFTTRPMTKRTRARSQWVFTPFTEANTDEIEGRQEESQNQGLEDFRICVV